MVAGLKRGNGKRSEQGCLMSPFLPALYVNMMKEEVMEDMEEGVKVGVYLLRDVRLADVQGMVASTEKGFREEIDRLIGTAKLYKMKINGKKTKPK